MNKKIIISIAVIIIIIISALLFINRAPQNQDNLIPASYSDGSVTIQAEFNNTNNTVTFSGSSLGIVTLPHAISASGARYANEDESVVFWEHQDELTITKDNQIIFRGRNTAL